MLRIRSLRMRNFKNVRKADFEFNDGIFLFSGSNGEGKSTLFHAIILLLFDSTVSNLKDYITWGEDEFDIGCRFVIDDIDMKMDMSYSEKKGGSRTLTLLNDNSVYTNKQAMLKLSEYLDIDVAKASTVSLENEYNLISVTPSKRREYLKNVYDLGFKDELARMDADMTSFNEKISSGKASILSLESQTFSKEAFSRLPFTPEEYETLKDEEKKIDTGIVLIEEKRKNYRSLQLKIEEQKQSISSMLSKKENIECGIEKLKKDPLYEKSFEDLRFMVRDNSSILKDESDKKISSLEEKIRLYEKDIESLNLEMSRLIVVDKTEVENYNPLIIDCEKSLSKEKGLLDNLREELRVLGTGVCPTCGQKVDPTKISGIREEIDSRTSIVASLEDKKKLLKSQESEAKSRLDSYSQECYRIFNAIKKDESCVEINTSSVNSEKKSIQSILESEHSRIESEVRLLTSNKHQIDEKLEMYGNQLSEVIESLKTEDYSKSLNEESLLSMSSIESEYENGKKRQEEIQMKISSYESIVSDNEKKKAINEAMDKKSDERDERVRELNEQLIRDSSSFESVASARVILSKEFPSYVISRMVGTLKIFVNEFLDKVYPKYKIDIEETKDALKITYGDNKADVKMASGFEKSAFSLAYMYALGKMKGYGVLFVDESDAAASDENSTRFYDTLGKSLRFFPQIFAITHREEAKELLKNDFHATVYSVVDGSYERDA